MTGSLMEITPTPKNNIVFPSMVIKQNDEKYKTFSLMNVPMKNPNPSPINI